MAGFERLIGLLADGSFHSGEEIGQQLQVSRAAVWKQLQKLSELGLSVESLKGKGYRLAKRIELLDRELIESELAAPVASHLRPLDIAFDIDSTSGRALSRLSLAEVGKGYVCLAERQTGGRGRRGRQWVSPFGCNLYLSLVWEFESGAAALEGLSLLVGIATVRTLIGFGFESVKLKWPNDILLDGKKLGGILLEMTGDPSGRCHVVVGIGLNVDMSTEGGAIDQPWAALSQFKPVISRNRLAAALLNELVPLLATYSSTGFAVYVDEWRGLDAYLNCPVKVMSGDKQVVGISRGVADNGALLLAVDGQEQRVYGGELSLRLHDDS
ncbi:MAG: bifunctional biotin--[acetyl-CoA-carboxylase] ligase/biotin operon repressor BirA [Cellvibrionaceae bacterium]